MSESIRNCYEKRIFCKKIGNNYYRPSKCILDIKNNKIISNAREETYLNNGWEKRFYSISEFDNLNIDTNMILQEEFSSKKNLITELLRELKSETNIDKEMTILIDSYYQKYEHLNLKKIVVENDLKKVVLILKNNGIEAKLFMRKYGLQENDIKDLYFNLSKIDFFYDIKNFKIVYKSIYVFLVILIDEFCKLLINIYCDNFNKDINNEYRINAFNRLEIIKDEILTNISYNKKDIELIKLAVYKRNDITHNDSKYTEKNWKKIRDICNSSISDDIKISFDDTVNLAISIDNVIEIIYREYLKLVN